MNCSKLWNREVLTSVLPKKFLNEKYKYHRENLLFEREKSLFPAMQDDIAREKTHKELRSLEREARLKGDMDVLHEIRKAKWKLLNRVPNKKKKLVRKCPVGGCQGFVSSKWKCGLCKSHICKDCNEVVCEGHACDPSAVETMKLLKKDTKPCPTCGEMIFKASGCSQMWCTSCHAVFDWNTMELEKGIIHNPHYYEFQRKNGTLERHPLDMPVCGEEVPAYHYFLRNMSDPTGNIGKVHRLYNHLVAYLRRVTVAQDLNYENRKKFMMGEISEYKFKTRIQRMEKAREKIRDVNDVVSMFRDVLRDLLLDLYQNMRTKEFLSATDNLCLYVNESLLKIKVLYNNCVMQFVDTGTFTMKYDSRVK
ncbi:MAG: hypothetical protein ACOYNN_14015 [Terrimicrobiaceae bacterium]